MRDTDLFQLALGLSSPWAVTRSAFDADEKRLDLYVDFPRGSRFACAQCGREGCAVHDAKEETWRHLDFFQHRTLLHARVPRVSCPDCGVRKAATPWARAGSGFTLLFEAYVLALAKAMPIRNAARLVGEHDTRLWRIVSHYVWRAVEAQDLSQVRQIAADETSARRGHDYISLFIDMAKRKVIFVADGKDAGTVTEFAQFLEAHGGEREAISDASIDMGAAFEAGIKANFANAEITFDKFHVIKLANEAVDEVRRQEARNNFQIKGRRYIFLKNVDKLTQEQKEDLSRLEAQNLDTIQAMQIRMNLQQLFKMDEKTARRFLTRWISWVQVCDLAPMKRLAKTIMTKADGVLRSIATGLSNGVLEAINGNVQAAKRKAKGYRTKRNLKAIVYLTAGDLLGSLPT
ncbi:MAG TPA: ISL3 family transposase [Rhodomicrobium sp.]|nr:ISL3 family transposase [Rhodomicrobium sp.]